MRILSRRGDLVEFAYLLVATIATILYHLPEDVTCELVDNFIKEQAAQERQITSQTFQEYIIQYFQNMLKAPIDEPIIVSKDSIQEMLIKLKQRDMIKGLEIDCDHSELSHLGISESC